MSVYPGACRFLTALLLLGVLLALPIETIAGPAPGKLYEAVDNFDLEECKALIKTGADVNEHNPDKEEWTPLMLAAYNGSRVIVQLLIDAGADLDLRDKFGYTALIRVASRGDYGTAFTERHYAAMEALVKAGADLDLKDKDGITALNWVCYRGYADAARLLVKAGADPDISDNEGKRPFDVASSVELRDILRDKGEKSPEEALLAAAQKGDTSKVQSVIGKCRSFDYSLSGGWTPLMYAADKKHNAILKLLLNAGASPNKQNESQESPLFLAAQAGNLEGVRLLIKAGADVNAINSTGATALMKAATGSSIDREGRFAIMKLLLDSGARKDIRTILGYTAEEIAQKNDRKDEAELIRNYRLQASNTPHAPMPTQRGFVENGPAMVPLRFLAEWLGLSVTNSSKTITISAQGHIIKVKVGSTAAAVDGSSTTLSAPVTALHDVTYVPLRFFAQALGAEVNWDSKKMEARLKHPKTGETKIITCSRLIRREIR